MSRFWSVKAGKTYYYHRARGARIHSELGTAAFVIEVDRLNRAWKAKTVAKYTLGHLIAEYRKTPEYLRLMPINKSDYERVLIMFEKAGGMPLSAISRVQVFTWRN